jgi:hypothetical protein
MSALSAGIEELVTPAMVQHLSAQSGVPGAKIQTGVTGAIASILEGLLGKAGDPKAMSQVAELAQRTPATDSPEKLLDNEAALQKNSSDLLGVVGGNSHGIVSSIASYLGVGGRAATWMVSAASAVVVGSFRKLGLDANTLSSTLTEHSNAIHAAVPAGMRGVAAPHSKWWVLPLILLVVLIAAIYGLTR